MGGHGCGGNRGLGLEIVAGWPARLDLACEARGLLHPETGPLALPLAAIFLVFLLQLVVSFHMHMSATELRHVVRVWIILTALCRDLFSTLLCRQRVLRSARMRRARARS
jgi:hypothetical protein